MQLQLSTWPEVEAYLTRSKAIMIPIGSTEQHGPTGLIGTDALTAELVARGVGDVTGALIGPTIPVGMAVHHMAFPGSMTLKPSTLVAVIADYLESLAVHGFHRFLFVNGHGGNINSVNAAFYEFYASRDLAGARSGNTRLRCALHNWWTGAKVSSLAREFFGDREGGHATPSEIAVTQHAYPQAIKHARLDPPLAPSGRFYDAADFRARFPDGRIGSDPSLASPEKGGRLLEAAIADTADLWHRFAEGD